MSTPVIRAGNCSEPLLAGCKIVQKEFIEHLNSETVARLPLLPRQQLTKALRPLSETGKKPLPVSHIVSFSFFPPTLRNLILKSTPTKRSRKKVKLKKAGIWLISNLYNNNNNVRIQMPL